MINFRSYFPLSVPIFLFLKKNKKDFHCYLPAGRQVGAREQCKKTTSSLTQQLTINHKLQTTNNKQHNAKRQFN